MSNHSRQLRIAQVLPELNEGGVERGVVELNREMVKRGVESIVISKGGGLAKQIDRDGGIHVHMDVCSKNPFSAPARSLELRQRLRELRPNILHARSRVPAWLCRFANRPLKIPFVTTVHGINSVSPFSKVMTTGEQVICVGEPVRQHIIKHYNTNTEKITVIPRGVDLSVFNPEAVNPEEVRSFRGKLGLEDKFVIGSVGRISKVKDFETVISAVAHLGKSYSDMVGLIVGGTSRKRKSYAESLQNLADTSHPEGIVFTGSQSNMPMVYSCCDLLVNASPLMGNVARTLLEAMAMDVPVLSLKLEGMEKLVRDGENGYIFNKGDHRDLAEKITMALENPPPSPRQSIPYEFTLDSMVDSTLSVYSLLTQ